MKKRMFIIAILLSLICVFAGCSKGNKLKEKDAEVITIYLRDFEDWSNNYFIKAIDKYNDNLEDGVEVQYLLLDDSSYTYKVDSSREAGDAPDIYMVSWTNLWQEVQNESIVSLEEIFDQEFLDDYTQTALDAATLYGKIYAVPYCFEPSMLLFYSKSMFQQAGITSVPTTYEEMLDCCEKLSGIITNVQTVVATPLAIPMGWANTGQFWNAAGGTFPISDDWSTSLVATTAREGYEKFLTFWSTLYKNGYASRSDSAGGYNEIINELCEGRVAMTYAGSYAVGQIYQDYINQGYLENADDIGCCLAPRLNQELGATSNGGWSFVFDASTTSRQATANEKVQGKTHAQLAADFIEWYTTDTTVATSWFELGKCCKQTGFKSIQAILDVTQETNPYYETIKEAANTAAPLNRYPYSITQCCSDMIQTLMSKTNTKSIAEIIVACNAQITSQISINQLAGKNPANN